MEIVAGQITVGELSAMAEATFGDLVKAVADVRRGLLAVDAGMHTLADPRWAGHRRREIARAREAT